ncbi:MAG: AMP-binding protein, partial [Firmicutes bacterium]|nr:AMP-binding protein [Bacillota bacterium]
MVSERKALEIKWAEEFVQGIKNDPHPSVQFKDDIRPITDMKDMITGSCEIFADNVAYLVKDKKGGEYREIKYRQVIEDVNGLGTALMAGGLKGKRIAVIGENSYMWEMAYLATICGIGIIVPLDKELSASELKQLVVAADVSCVFFDKKFEEMFKEMKASGDTSLEVLVNMHADSSNAEVLSWKELVETGKNMVASGDRTFIDAEVYNDEMSILLFTSGTTGISKGVMLSHKNIAADIMTAPSVFGVHPTDRFFSFLPVHHTYACTCDFMIPLYKGASIAICE